VNRIAYNSVKDSWMNGASMPGYRATLMLAVVFGVLIGFFAYIVTHFPWHVTGTLLDMSEQVELSSFMGREFITFLRISATRLMVFGASGGGLGLIVFAVLWKRRSKAIWLRGCTLTALLMSIPGNLLLILAEAYIQSRYVWPPHEYDPLSLDILYSLFTSIPGLLCLTPVGLVVGIALQTIMKARHRGNVN
jgi:hypothetical protein